MSSRLHFGAYDYDSLVFSEFLDTRAKEYQTTVAKSLKLVKNLPDFTKWIDSFVESVRYVVVQLDGNSGFIATKKGVAVGHEGFIQYDIRGTMNIQIHGDAAFVQNITSDVLNIFELVKSKIEWVYNVDGSSIEIPLDVSRLPLDEMYPFLGEEKLTDYYERFMRSRSNILLLIGPPGTGKTSFIKGLLSHTESSAMLSYDGAILEDDRIFSSFIENEDASIMVLEDSDNFLKARSDGNTMMHRFLNVGDGLVTRQGKKIIFSTNLPSVRDIDSALMRPGRCFDVLTFDHLNKEQAQKLAEKAGVVLPEASEVENKYSVAEIFNGKNKGVEQQSKTRSFGFN